MITFTSDLDLLKAIPVEKNKKIEKKNFKNFSPLTAPRGYPISGPIDQISKNPSVIPRVIPLGGPMQNFIQFGPVDPQIEGVGTKK